MNHYFSLFELPVSFEVDIGELEKRYFAVQRACHPDRLVGKPPEQRQQAILRSMQANEAFEALKHPLSRARHILALQGIHVGGEKDSVKPGHALLMEIMELRETLEAADSADKVAQLKTQNAHSIAQQVESVSSQLASAEWERAAQATIRLGYLLKIEDEIRLKGKAV